MLASAACCVFAFGVVCAVVSVHMDTRHALPAGDLPFAPLRPCQVFVDAF